MPRFARTFAFAGLILAAVMLVRTERTALSSRQPGQRAAAKAPLVNPVQRQEQLATSYGRLPLSFEANLGQSDPHVKFLARGQGYALFLTRNEAVLSLRSGGAGNLWSFLRRGNSPDDSGTASEPAVATLRMKLANISPSARLEGMQKLPGAANYFIGNDPRKWRTNVPTYAKVKYHQIYPGIDLVYYGEQRQLEYDFVVAPGADLQQIALDIQGARELHEDAQGDLVAQTGAGEVRLHKPVAYQWSSDKGPSGAQGDGGKHFVDARFKLRGRNRVKFVAVDYDPAKPLIIDPVLTYATFLGGSGEDIGIGIAADSAGNAYVTGGTLSTNFPTTSGVEQPTFGGPSPHCGGSIANFLCGDAFVTKIDQTGTTILASTYLGGSDADVGFRIALDSAGFIYVAGRTASANFPVTPGVFQQMFGGGICGQSGGRPCPDGFITKIDPSFASLTYSSFIGGNGDDSVSGLAVDFAGNAFLAGQTESANFPTTTGSLSPNPIGGTCTAGTLSAPCPHAFVAEVNPSGTMLTYSTYLGGHGDDGALGIALDAADDAFVVGSTDSTDFPGTTGHAQPAFGGGTTAPAACQNSICGDGFLAELNATGSALIYATYIGGNGDDAATNVVVDSAGNAYVTGDTDSSNFFTTAGAPQRTFGGGSTSCAGRLVTCGDAFAVKVNSTGTTFLYSTYIGGSGDDGSFFGSAVDSAGDLYVGGTTNSTNFPTASPIQATFGGGSPTCIPSQELCGDGFVTEINPSGTAFVFSTYLGGSSDDGVAGLTLDAHQNILITGFTASPNFPVTPGVAQTKCGTDGNCNALSDAFVAKMGLSPFKGPYALGEVFAADGVGFVDVFKPDGTFLGIMDTKQGQSAGMTFDKTGNLYVTNFCTPQAVSKFDSNANLLGTFGSGYTTCPESILFDQAGHAFVGAATPGSPTTPTVPIYEFDAAGNPIMTFQAVPESRGSDWIELLADQHTMLYTSEGHLVKNFNIQSNMQNPDFATQLPGSFAYALRQLPNGNVLVADSEQVVQLNSSGSVIQTYTTNPPSMALFALNLDPDGTTFWTADLNTGAIFHFNIQSGTQLSSFNVLSSGIASGLAIFGEKAPGTNNLTVTKAGTGTGTVTSNPAGINCGAVCTSQFTSGSNVMLTATPDPGSTFAGFTGGCTGTSPCTVTMNGDQAVTATFNLQQFILTVTDAGTGSGTVTSQAGLNPAINCTTGSATGCSANYNFGTMVTLTATAATGSTFAGWSGACTNSTGTCMVTMSQAQNVTATFNGQQFTLTVTDAGTGSGTVTSQAGLNPAINCTSGSATGCSANYNFGTSVTLTATPATGSTFTGWSGACEGTGTCTVTMNSNQAVTATFNTSASNFTLTVTEAGNGSGTVTSSPPGINCPTTCSASFPPGTMVTLTATAATNSTFTGWDACTGTGTCTVTMNANQSVTATFTLDGAVNFILSPGPGGGTSATVQPGDTAVFLFNLSSVNGFTGKVNLSCASQQPTITCSIVPSMVNLGPGITATMITVNTFCAWLGPRFGPLDKTPGPWLPSLATLLALAMFVAITGIRRQKLRLVSPLATLALFAISFAGCASVPHGPSGATPPGTYNLTITASAPGSAPQSITVKLIVL